MSATAADQSESSGEIARDFDGPPEFYGWTGLDFHKVAAPMCNNDASPPPTSRDPVRPGALVPTRKPHEAPKILIGTMSNLRNGSLYTDGCGIALYLDGWDGNCFLGSWRNWGIVTDGTGTFRACPVESPAM